MQTYIIAFDLQLFADGGAGGGAAGGEGAGVSAAAAGQPSGVTTAAAGQTTTASLEDLGVPKERAERYRASKSRRGETAPAPAAAQAQTEPEPAPAQEQAPAADQQAAAAANDVPAAQPQTPNWDELMKDPEINRRMQQTVSARVKAFQKTLEDLTPAIELVSKKYGMDTSDMTKFDYKAFAQAVTNDDTYYEGIAKDLGVNRSTAKAITQREQQVAARERQVNETLQEQALRQHFDRMETQAAQLKQSIPSFDLREALKDPAFARMVSPSGGLSVDQAYYALHYREIEQAKAQQTANQVAQALSNSVQSGGKLPRENGITSTGSEPVTNKLYSQMSKAERAEWKARKQREAAFRR